MKQSNAGLLRGPLPCVQPTTVTLLSGGHSKTAFLHDISKYPPGELRAVKAPTWITFTAGTILALKVS